MAELKNKELWEAAEQLIAEHERKLAERLKNLPEKLKPYESFDDILIKRFHYTQEEIDNFRFRRDRKEYEAKIQRFLNTEF